MTDEENQERGGLGDRNDRDGIVLARAQDCGAEEMNAATRPAFVAKRK